jgi:peptide deformylase
MAIRNIVPDTDPIIHKKSKIVTNFDDKLKILLDDMADTLRLAEGIGLAAVQVGILRRVFIIDTGEETGMMDFINPEIIERDGEQEGGEGCLSIKGYEGFVKRPLNVVVKAQNRFGKEFTYSASELMARAVCHEYDHLDGFTIRDRAEYEVIHEDDDEEVQG